MKWPTVSAQVFRSFPVPPCKCGTAQDRMAASHSQGREGGPLAEKSERKR